MKKHPQSKRESSKNWLKDQRVAREIDDLFDQMASRWASKAEKLMHNVARNTTPQKKHSFH